MFVQRRSARVARGVGVVAAAGLFAATAAGLTPLPPDPEPAAGSGDSCLEFSRDGRGEWGDVSVVRLDASFTPVPGGDYLQGGFHARNRCAAALLRVYAGAWRVSGGGSGLWRADLGGATATPVELAGPAVEDDWGVLIGEVAAPTGQAIPVKLRIGVPADETRQGYALTPAWALALEHTDPATGRHTTSPRGSVEGLLPLDDATVRAGR